MNLKNILIESDFTDIKHEKYNRNPCKMTKSFRKTVVHLHSEMFIVPVSVDRC